jgi:hypothetical protein
VERQGKTANFVDAPAMIDGSAMTNKIETRKRIVGGRKMSSAKEADVSKLDNPAWSKVNHQARTDLCV